jgi:cell division protease FtsH
MDLPDINEREQILAIHVKNKPIEPAVRMRTLAERTPGFSGADLANLVNEAAILATRRNKKTIGMTELAESVEKVILGPERRSRVINVEEKKIVAYHEGGHALVGASLPHADPVHKVSIISRGHAGGYTLSVPEDDKSLHSHAYFLDELAVFLGGYASEKLVFGDITTGPSNDLERATSMARSMVTRYGMSRLGARTFGKKKSLCSSVVKCTRSVTTLRKRPRILILRLLTILTKHSSGLPPSSQKSEPHSIRLPRLSLNVKPSKRMSLPPS